MADNLRKTTSFLQNRNMAGFSLRACVPVTTEPPQQIDKRDSPFSCVKLGSQGGRAEGLLATWPLSIFKTRGVQ